MSNVEVHVKAAEDHIKSGIRFVVHLNRTVTEEFSAISLEPQTLVFWRWMHHTLKGYTRFKSQGYEGTSVAHGDGVLVH